MRTTIEIPDHLRARLIELAARRGMKGYSGIVQEAIEHYLAAGPQQRERLDAALSVLGTLPAREADAMQRSVRDLRRRWR